MTNYTHLRELLASANETPDPITDVALMVEMRNSLPTLLDRLDVLEHYNATLIKTCDHMRKQRGKEQARMEKLASTASRITVHSTVSSLMELADALAAYRNAGKGEG